MKLRAVLLCLTLLVAAASPAAAGFPIDIPGQLYLGWGDCQGGGGLDYAFLDCNTPGTSNSRILYASMTTPLDIPEVIADFGLVDVTVGSDPLNMPPFWSFHATGCGDGQMLFSCDFLTAPGGCYDMWGGAALGGGQYGGETGPTPAGSRARIKWACALTSPNMTVLPGGVQTYTQRITLRNLHLFNCPGCPEPACLVYNEEQINDLSGRTLRITNPGYAAANALAPLINCPGSTPVRQKTWGQVKALYR